MFPCFVLQMGTFGVNMDTRLVHQQGVLTTVTEERDAARAHLGDLVGRVRTCEAVISQDRMETDNLREALARRDADLARAEEKRLKLADEVETKWQRSEEARQMLADDMEVERTRLSEESRRLQQELEAERRRVNDTWDRFVADLQAERARSAAAEDAALDRGYADG